MNKFTRFVKCTCRDIRRFFKRIFGKKYKDPNGSYNITVDQRYVYEESTIVLEPGLVDVPGSSTFKYIIYLDKYNRTQWMVTEVTEYFFFFIPFRYDRYIIELPKGKFSPDVQGVDINEAWKIKEKACYNQKGMKKKDVGPMTAFLYQKYVDRYEMGDSGWIYYQYTE